MSRPSSSPSSRRSDVESSDSSSKHSLAILLLAGVLGGQIYTSSLLRTLQLGCYCDETQPTSLAASDYDAGGRTMRSSGGGASASDRSSSVTKNYRPGSEQPRFNRVVVGDSRPPMGNRASVRPGDVQGAESLSSSGQGLLTLDDDSEAEVEVVKPAAARGSGVGGAARAAAGKTVASYVSHLTGIGVVLGVGGSAYAKSLLSEWTAGGGLYLCDPFIQLVNGGNSRSDMENQLLFERTQEELAQTFGQHRFSMVRDLAHSFATTFRASNAQASLVFADNDASRIEEDLRDWSTLVHPGGVLAGTGYSKVRQKVEAFFASYRGGAAIEVLDDDVWVVKM